MIEKKWMLFAIVYSIAHTILIYAAQAAATPQGMVYINSRPDEMITQASMAAYKFGFLHPYVPGNTLVFADPVMGSVYIFTVLGLLPNSLWAIAAMRFVLLLFYIIAAMLLIQLFSNNNRQRNVTIIIFFLVLSSFGVMNFWNDLRPSWFQFESGYGHLGVASQLYYPVVLGAGYAALWALAQRRIWLATALLAVGIVAHPQIGIVIWVVAAAYTLYVQGRFEWRLILAAAAAGLLWVVPIALNTTMFQQYSMYYYSDHIDFDQFLFSYGLLVVLALAGLVHVALERPLNKTGIFIGTWFVALTLLVIAGWFFPSRLVLMIMLPAAILSGRILSNARYYYVVLALLLAVSIPAHIDQFQLHVKQAVYISEDDTEAFDALRVMPNGMVLAPPDIARFVPVLAEKRAAFGRWPIPDSQAEYQHVLQSVSARKNYSYIMTREPLDLPVLYNGSIKIYGVEK